MAITKTKFMNYSRCPRYVALEKVKENRLQADVSYEDYKNEEHDEKLQELLNKMYEDREGEEIDLIDISDPQLEIMLPYFQEIEMLAGRKGQNLFGGETFYAEETFAQKKFFFEENGIKYLCYVDVCNKNKKTLNIIEVKGATTSFLKDTAGGYRAKEKFPLFLNKNNVYYFKDEVSNYDISDEMPLKTYQNKKNKFLQRYEKVGRYVYDLAVQRMIIEKSGVQNVRYFLAFLNHEYIFDGVYEKKQPVYDDEIISIFDMTEITKSLQPNVLADKENIEKYLAKSDARKYRLGKYCEYKKNTKCKFTEVCFSHVPKENSVFSYINSGKGFKIDDNTSYKAIDLVNMGYLHMLDIPEKWLRNPNHFIQRNATVTKNTYIDKEKMALALQQLEYPLYHLDFETFPCPLPRFSGEKCYDQSPFQFSIHIENIAGKCDSEKNHYEFLATSFEEDQRERLVAKLCEIIDLKEGGMVLAQNISFEKKVLKYLANNFPKYQKELNQMIDNLFDLLYIVRNKRELYKDLGFSEEEAKKVNYYHYKLSGSYSLKKTISVFSNLSYDNLDVRDGVEALVTYANFDKYKRADYEQKYQALIKYCKQDSYAMFVILKKVRELLKENK